MRSLRARLFLAIGLAVLVSIGLTLGVGTVLARHSIERSIEANLGRQADALAVRERNGRLEPAQILGLRALFAREGERLLVLPALPPFLPASGRQALLAGRPAQGKASVLGQDVLYAARPAGGSYVVLVRTARLGVADVRPFVGGFILAGAAGALIAGVASFLLARAIVRPVARVAEAARSLAAGRAPGPIPVEGSDELAVLASSFNDMAVEIERARESEQSFLLSVSHELKTPLTAIRGYAEALSVGAVSGAEGGEVVGAEAARLERLVQDLLDLARLNRRAFAIRREPVDLAAVAREAVRRHEHRARSFGVAVGAEAPASAPAMGDRDRVLQVVSNLVENAIRATPAGGRVTVEARPGIVSVVDTGPGLPAADLPRAFERFFLYRRSGGDRRVGSGLGLAIVKELTEAMGGTVSVDSAVGRGTTFAVRLPAAFPI